MNTPQKVLIPYDFSEPSKKALKRGAELANAFGASLLVLHVWETPEWSRLENFVFSEVDLIQRIERQLQIDLDALLPDQDPERLTVQIVQGNTIQEILGTIQKEKTELTVLGSHGRTGFTRLLLGSVAEKVLRVSPTPVWIQRGENIPIKTILVPVDFSDFSTEAIVTGAAWAERLGARLHLLHVISIGDFYVFDPVSIPVDRALLEEQLKKQAHEKLAQLTKNLKVSFEIELGWGEAASEIAACAEKQKADLVVIPTHGRTGFTHALLGSTAEKTARQSPCSVLTFRPGGAEELIESGFRSQDELEDYLKTEG